MIFSIVYGDDFHVAGLKLLFFVITLFHHLSTPGLPIPDYILIFRFSLSPFESFYNVLYIRVYESVQR